MKQILKNGWIKNQTGIVTMVLFTMTLLVIIPVSAYTSIDQTDNLFTRSGSSPSLSINSGWDEGTYVEGFVKNANLQNNDITVYIRVNGLWWGPKPYWADPITKINFDGTFRCKYVTGGNDQDATNVVAYLIPKGYVPPSLAGSYRLSEELKTFPSTSSYRSE